MNTDIAPTTQKRIATVSLDPLPEKAALIRHSREMLDAWEADEWKDANENFLKFIVWLHVQVARLIVPIIVLVTVAALVALHPFIAPHIAPLPPLVEHLRVLR